MSIVERPECDMSQVDGNVFMIIGHVAKVLRRAGLREREQQWRAAAVKCGSYDEVLHLMEDFVEVV